MPNYIIRHLTTRYIPIRCNGAERILNSARSVQLVVTYQRVSDTTGGIQPQFTSVNPDKYNTVLYRNLLFCKVCGDFHRLNSISLVLCTSTLRDDQVIIIPDVSHLYIDWKLYIVPSSGRKQYLECNRLSFCFNSRTLADDKPLRVFLTLILTFYRDGMRHTSQVTSQLKQKSTRQPWLPRGLLRKGVFTFCRKNQFSVSELMAFPHLYSDLLLTKLFSYTFVKRTLNRAVLNRNHIYVVVSTKLRPCVSVYDDIAYTRFSATK